MRMDLSKYKHTDQTMLPLGRKPSADMTTYTFINGKFARAWSFVPYSHPNF